MSMKIVYGFLLALFLTGLPLYAQDQPPGDGHEPPSADEIVAKMQSKLNLTQDQVTAITPIIEKYSSKREELKEGAQDGTVDRNDMHAQMKQLKEDESQELSQILSADQLSQWNQMMSQRRHKQSSEGNSEGGAGIESSGNREGGGNGGG